MPTPAGCGHENRDRHATGADRAHGRPDPGMNGVRAIVERNLLIYKHVWWPLAAALIEPIMYLAAIGVGVGTLVGTIPGVSVDYASYVAPAILATTAMNSAFNQTSFGVYL